MAGPTISLSPMLTTNAAGNFVVTSDGLVQGTAYDSPNSRFNLAQGAILSSVTQSIYGGMGISESIPASPGNSVLQGNVAIAAALTGLTGFSVFDQAYGAINSPGSPVPLLGAYQTCNFYRLGSGARIALKMAPQLVSLDGGLINQQVSWDYVGQQLVPYITSYASASVQSATYTSSTGILALTFASAPAGSAPAAGTYFGVSGLQGSGAGLSQLSGSFALVSSSSAGAVLNLQAPANLGTVTITSATGTLAAGGGALPCTILQVQPSGCMTVNYNPVTGLATWNNNGACAVVNLQTQ